MAFIIKLLQGKKPVIYGNGGKRRDLVHVDDVNDFHLMCIKDEQTTGEVSIHIRHKGCSFERRYDSSGRWDLCVCSPERVISTAISMEQGVSIFRF